jgi:hypothetical protein
VIASERGKKWCADETVWTGMGSVSRSRLRAAALTSHCYKVLHHVLFGDLELECGVWRHHRADIRDLHRHQCEYTNKSLSLCVCERRGGVCVCAEERHLRHEDSEAESRPS